ncbi:hypothetical protein [Niallia sp. Krafla_26]|uniref:hypothetical protein n=1 Tax=Niallia sp. Krafla_26 TaxID=3064703 RepID=UPI003D16957D
MLDKALYIWHSMKSRHYEELVNDCLSESLRSKLIIKANYHRELATVYSTTISI